MSLCRRGCCLCRNKLNGGAVSDKSEVGSKWPFKGMAACRIHRQVIIPGNRVLDKNILDGQSLSLTQMKGKECEYKSGFGRVG